MLTCCLPSCAFTMRVIFSTVTLLNVSGGTLACGVGEACARHKNVSLDCVMGVVMSCIPLGKGFLKILTLPRLTRLPPLDSLTYSTLLAKMLTPPTQPTAKVVVCKSERTEHMGTQHEPELRPKQSMLIISNRNIKLC